MNLYSYIPEDRLIRPSLNGETHRNVQEYMELYKNYIESLGKQLGIYSCMQRWVWARHR